MELEVLLREPTFSHELLALEWPWKNQFGFLSEISRSFLAIVGVTGILGMQWLFHGPAISESVASPQIWFSLSISVHAKSSPTVQMA